MSSPLECSITVRPCAHIPSCNGNKYTNVVIAFPANYNYKPPGFTGLVVENQ